MDGYNILLNWRFFVGLFDTCHIPDDWAYKAKKNKKMERREKDLSMALQTSLRVR